MKFLDEHDVSELVKLGSGRVFHLWTALVEGVETRFDGAFKHRQTRGVVGVVNGTKGRHYKGLCATLGHELLRETALARAVGTDNGHLACALD